jgi:hypothetical protein
MATRAARAAMTTGARTPAAPADAAQTGSRVALDQQEQTRVVRRHQHVPARPGVPTGAAVRAAAARGTVPTVAAVAAVTAAFAVPAGRVRVVAVRARRAVPAVAAVSAVAAAPARAAGAAIAALGVDEEHAGAAERKLADKRAVGHQRAAIDDIVEQHQVGARARHAQRRVSARIAIGARRAVAAARTVVAREVASVACEAVGAVVAVGALQAVDTMHRDAENGGDLTLVRAHREPDNALGRRACARRHAPRHHHGNGERR